MGDAAFLFHIAGLCRPPRPLLRVATGDARAIGGLRRSATLPSISLEDDLELTDDGRRVLQGHADRVALCGIDRWLGGVHLTGNGPVWRWDRSASIVRLA